MNPKPWKIHQFSVALLTLSVLPSTAFSLDLMATESLWSPPDGGQPIVMWGFAEDTGDCATAPPLWNIGPQLNAAPGSTLVVNLRNCLKEGVSLVIPGQRTSFTPVVITDDQGRQRVTSFTHEAPPNGGMATYTWTNIRPGTYLYQSGSHPAKQVQMGLYGAMVSGTYPGASAEATLLYSEIDPLLHNPPAPATPRGYKPRYFLVNGSASRPALPAGGVGTPTLVRMLNAGLDFHVPTLNSAYFSIVAEDGNPYPYPKIQYSAFLPAGKTLDALWQPDAAGLHVIYDRQLSPVAVSLGVDVPVAIADAYVGDEGVTVTVAAPGVLGNDVGAGLSATLVTGPLNGQLDAAGLMPDGSFNYIPDAGFNGIDSFEYRASPGGNTAVVTVLVRPANAAPVALDDNFAFYDIPDATPVDAPAPGVLANDTDADSTLTVDTTPVVQTQHGTLVLNADGSFQYTPTQTPVTDSFTYSVTDGNSTAHAQVFIKVTQPNTAPMAVDDYAIVAMNLGAVVNLVDNDSDAENNLRDHNGNVQASQISITTGGTSFRGGSVIPMVNGAIYTPPPGFSGIDYFRYRVTDNPDDDLSNPPAGLTSNEVNVWIKVK